MVAVVDGGGPVTLLVADGLFKLVLGGSVLVDGRLGGGVRWCMLGSLWVIGGLVELSVTVLVVRWSGKVGLCMLVENSVAVWWQ